MGVFRKKRPFYGLEKRPKNPQKSRAGLGFFPPPPGGVRDPPPGGGVKRGIFDHFDNIADLIKVGIHSLASPIR